MDNVIIYCFIVIIMPILKDIKRKKKKKNFSSSILFFLRGLERLVGSDWKFFYFFFLGKERDLTEISSGDDDVQVALISPQQKDTCFCEHYIGITHTIRSTTKLSFALFSRVAISKMVRSMSCRNFQNTFEYIYIYNNRSWWLQVITTCIRIFDLVLIPYYKYGASPPPRLFLFIGLYILMYVCRFTCLLAL